MSLTQPILQELEMETPATKRILERVPDDKLGWKPHARSMSLGDLALHIATTPGGIAGMVSLDSFDVATFTPPKPPESRAAILSAFDESLAKAREILNGMDDARALGIWRAFIGPKEIMAVPRVGVLRMILLNHLYHHRGQLSVYLRLLDVPVPSIYGPSADENPFA